MTYFYFKIDSLLDFLLGHSGAVKKQMILKIFEVEHLFGVWRTFAVVCLRPFEIPQFENMFMESFYFTGNLVWSNVLIKS